MDKYSMKNIFISYSHKDKSFVDMLTKDFDTYKITYWLDEKELQIGDMLLRNLREGIDKSQFLLIILSKNSISSEWVQRELDLALNEEISKGVIKVLPAVIDKEIDLPSFLVGKIYADFSKDYRDGLKGILNKLGISPNINRPVVMDISKPIIMASIFADELSSQKELLDICTKFGFIRNEFRHTELQCNDEISGGYLAHCKKIDKDVRKRSMNFYLRIRVDTLYTKDQILICITEYDERDIFVLIGNFDDVKNTLNWILSLGYLDSAFRNDFYDILDVLDGKKEFSPLSTIKITHFERIEVDKLNYE
jgi:hypothetical protein